MNFEEIPLGKQCLVNDIGVLYSLILITSCGDFKHHYNRGNTEMGRTLSRSTVVTRLVYDLV